MANETLALIGQPLTPDRLAEDDYQSFCAALGSSARGRAFLSEYARRNRHADTEIVLAALHRLQQTAHSERAEPEADRIRQDLRALLDTLRTARPPIDNSPSAIKAATLASLIDFTQARLEALLAAERAPSPHGALAQAALVQVPDLDQPELPIPRPAAATSPPAIALVQPVAAPMPVPAPLADSPPAGFNSDLAAPAAEQPRASRTIPIPEVNFAGRAVGEAAAKPAPAGEPMRLETPMPIAAPAFIAPAPAAVTQAVEQTTVPEAPAEPAIAPQAELRDDAQASVQTTVTVAAPTGAPTKPAVLSPRQAAIAALAAQTNAQANPPAHAPTGPIDTAPTGALSAEQNCAPKPAPAKPAVLSPRQAAIAALAAQGNAEAKAQANAPAGPGNNTPTGASAGALSAEQNPAPAPAKPAVLSPRQAAIAALAAQGNAVAKAQGVPHGKEQAAAPAEPKSEARQPAAAAPPAAAPAQPAADPLAAIMELSEDERIALFT